MNRYKKIILIISFFLSCYASVVAQDNDNLFPFHAIFNQSEDDVFQIKVLADVEGKLEVNCEDYFKQNPKKMQNLDINKQYLVYLCLSCGEVYLARISDSVDDVYNEALEKTYTEKLVKNRFNKDDFLFVTKEDFFPTNYKKDSLENTMLRISKRDFKYGFYISDVLAISQYGGAIYFKGKSKSKVMTINGLGKTKSKQSVSVYYKIVKDEKTDYCEWTVMAIKKR